MRDVVFRRCAVVAFLCSALWFTSQQPLFAKATAVSTDGEATVYLNANFSHAFDLKYRVVFEPAPKNKSWSVVDIVLLGSGERGGSVSVGLSRGFPTSATLAGFTTLNVPGEKPRFKSFPVFCSVGCVVELRGTSQTIEAVIGDRKIESWARGLVGMRHPAVQLNAEVAARGDTLSAAMLPLRVMAAGTTIRPTCAFTTQGVEPKAGPGGRLLFTGARTSHARVTYLSLVTGSTGESCRGL